MVWYFCLSFYCMWEKKKKAACFCFCLVFFAS